RRMGRHGADHLRTQGPSTWRNLDRRRRRVHRSIHRQRHSARARQRGTRGGSHPPSLFRRGQRRRRDRGEVRPTPPRAVRLAVPGLRAVARGCVQFKGAQRSGLLVDPPSVAREADEFVGDTEKDLSAFREIPGVTAFTVCRYGRKENGKREGGRRGMFSSEQLESVTHLIAKEDRNAPEHTKRLYRAGGLDSAHIRRIPTELI